MAENVQPVEGQGGEATGGLFDSYLQAVPEEHRETVTGYLKDAEKNVNERIAKASELEKQWGPYSEIQNLPPPEQLSELLAWSNETLTSQERFDEWVTELAQAKGMTMADAAEEVEDAEVAGLTPEQIQQMIAEGTQQALSPLQEQQQEFMEERGIDLETEAIKSTMSQLEKEAGITLDETQRGQVYKLGMPFAYDEQGNELPAGDTSWIAPGFAEFKAIGEQANKAFVLEKSAAPQGAIATGGVAQAKPITTFADAALAARERFKAELQG